MSELVKRVLVAIVGIPLAFVVVYAGGWVFCVAIALISTLGLLEFYSIAHKKGAFPQKFIGLLCGLGIILYAQLDPALGITQFLFIGLLMAVLAVMTIELFIRKPNASLNISTTLLGILYVPLLFSTMLFIRNINKLSSNSPYFQEPISGAWLVIIIFITVWVCDSAAYFIGKKFGKHKISPRISPKKSWEGAIAGLVFGIAASVVTSLFLLPGVPIHHSIVIGALVGTFGQIGDFAESQLKRDAGVKDSSNLIPGHGGVLDRFDSILFVMPLVFVYLYLMLID